MTDLARLASSRDLLNVVVIGPRRGESVLVGSRDRGWLVIDSLRGDQHNDQELPHPVLAALWQLGGEVALLALTHPHDDHAVGFSDLVAHCTAPVGCVPQLVPHRRGTSSTRLHLAASVDDALAAIREAWEDESTDRIWRLAPGPDADRMLGDVLVEVLSPSREEVEAVLATENPDLNAISTAMRVTWQELEFVLGADLTTDGWHGVDSRRGGTGAAAAMHKGSHHGSSTAHHPWALGSAPPVDRAVAITPYSVKVPNFDLGRDVDLLHQTIGSLRMTAVRGVAATAPLTMTTADVRSHRAGTFAGLLAVLENPPHLAWDAWWAWSFDETGVVVDMRHGPSAKVVTPG
ncbi:MAG: MBL fold metallo-hydrolase [Acidimicrobiia bacterium]